MPVSGLWQTPIQPCSGKRGLAEDDGALLRAAARSPAHRPAPALRSLVREPRRVGRPLAQILSLIVAGTPSTAPSGAPRRQRASDCAAAASDRLGVERHEGVEAPRRLDAREHVARDLDRRERAGAVELGQARPR